MKSFWGFEDISSNVIQQIPLLTRAIYSLVKKLQLACSVACSSECCISNEAIAKDCYLFCKES